MKEDKGLAASQDMSLDCTIFELCIVQSLSFGLYNPKER